MLNGGDHAPGRSGASLYSMHGSAPAIRRLPQTRSSDERRSGVNLSKASVASTAPKLRRGVRRILEPLRETAGAMDDDL
jgi:hypothetical protein